MYLLQPELHIVRRLVDLNGKSYLFFRDIGRFGYLLQVPANMEDVAWRVLVRYSLKQRDAGDHGINQYWRPRGYLSLDIRKPIQVVQNTYNLAMYKCSTLHVLVLPDIPGAAGPLQDLFRISKQPDIQSSC